MIGSDVSKRDTLKINKRSLQAQEWVMDIKPHKQTKKAKVKERQNGKKLAKEGRSE